MSAWPMPGRELGQIPLPVGPGKGEISTHPSVLLTMNAVARGSGKGTEMVEARVKGQGDVSLRTLHLHRWCVMVIYSRVWNQGIRTGL